MYREGSKLSMSKIIATLGQIGATIILAACVAKSTAPPAQAPEMAANPTSQVTEFTPKETPSVTEEILTPTLKITETAIVTTTQENLLPPKEIPADKINKLEDLCRPESALPHWISGEEVWGNVASQLPDCYEKMAQWVDGATDLDTLATSLYSQGITLGSDGSFPISFPSSDTPLGE